jgi:hypothetical protein
MDPGTLLQRAFCPEERGISREDVEDAVRWARKR